MAVRKYKPTSPGRRFMTVSTFEEITKTEPEKSLTEPLKKKGGRNDNGRITTRHQGGGHKRRYRDRSTSSARRTACRRRSPRSSTTRTARRASRCCTTPTARRRTSSRPARLQVGATVESGPGADIKPGQRAAAREHPDRHARPQRRAQAGPRRPDGAQRRLGHPARREGRAATRVLRLPSGELRRVPLTCRATVGQVGNVDHENITGGKAGRSRWRGKRPTVRGSAMNPVDHPHGGGEGKSKGGRHPVTPWGVPTLGKRTRKQAQGIRQVDRPRPPPRQGEAVE